MTSKTHIVIPIYPGVTQLDFTGPHQFFSRVPQAEVVVASVGGLPVEAQGLTFTNLADLEDITACDMLCVPGGLGCLDAAEDARFLHAIQRLAGTARYLTSVCTGSLILGAAGLLRGRHAACHWAWRDMLPLFGAIPDAGRIVRDGNLITGGGVTAGIDLALTVIAELLGDETAQAAQLTLEYAPEPPFDAGRPDTAPASVHARVLDGMADMQASRYRQAERIATRLTS
ncbi:DJ-1/PfpI family protein [Chromohalobacter canadensis]|uniref:DJ-1/PfpI family protein n=1 Tax=Chromohalobacter canadensis TaxID=141389 RepID=UPI0021C072D4|nr:DJ-1/PfpI family protein [Chromohalobacter canadensis]MCT8468914.1 DJ-1/PfpI family protein [Chromohalobacter canadensis]MCT8472896.1 DJ-1/PfpI family protein [Chromohalobacter canadensis]MCT8500348.1 DJ-1/PfpI family protein [Chromohalobacter canadensis]